MLQPELQSSAHCRASYIAAEPPMYAVCHVGLGLLLAIVEEDEHAEEGGLMCTSVAHELMCAFWP